MAGCRSTVDGKPTTANPSASSSAAGSAALDTGNYPTKPLAPLGVAGDHGAFIEAQRMADYVTGPWEIDAGLIKSYSLGVAPFVNPKSIAQIAPKGAADKIGQHHFINGFASARQVEGQTILENAVLRFVSPEDASAAADDMVDAARTMKVLTPPVEDATIPGHPEALATRHVVTDIDSGRRWSNVHSFTAHGPYVLVQTSESTDGFDKAVGMISKTLDLQTPLIDQFPATDPAKFAELPLDPSGLRVHVLPRPANDPLEFVAGTYGRHGALHFMMDPVTSSALFDETGMDTAVFGLTNLYQAKDAAGAAKLAEEFAKEVGSDGQSADAVADLESSKCVTIPSSGFYCTAVADRYALESNAAQLPAAHQQLAAQYELALAK